MISISPAGEKIAMLALLHFGLGRLVHTSWLASGQRHGGSYRVGRDFQILARLGLPEVL